MQVRAYKLDIIVQADDLAARTGLDVLLVYVARLIVEEPVGVSAPGDTPHVHSKSQISALAKLTRITGYSPA